MSKWLLLGLVLAFALPASADEPPIPQLELWEENMLTYGNYWCDYFDAHTPGEIWGLSYYDAGRVYRQIMEYTGDTATWEDCANKIMLAYRDEYVVANGGNIAGYWNFTTGLRLHYVAESDATSKTASINTSNAGTTFCGDGVSLIWTADANGSREVAYCILNYINNELMGETRRTRLTQVGADNDLTDQALDHLDQWFVTKDFRFPSGDSDVPQCSEKYGYKPFMVAITAQALIQFEALTGDVRVQPALETAYETMWADMFDVSTQSFPYVNCKTNPGDAWPAFPGPDYDTLLLHVANLAWLYQETSDTDWRDKADAIFSSGVQNAWVQGYKQFNQSYITSFDYVTIRQAQGGGPTIPHLREPSIDAGSTYATFKFGVDITTGTSIDFNSDCTLTVKTSPGGATADTLTSSTGLSVRTVTSTALTASTAYTVEQSCVGLTSDTNLYSFTTKATPAGGSRTVPIASGNPPTFPDAARATVRYDDNAALSTPATAQNTDCASGCTINLTLAAGLWYYRWEWQDASNNVLGVGAVQALPVP